LFAGLPFGYLLRLPVELPWVDAHAYKTEVVKTGVIRIEVFHIKVMKTEAFRIEVVKTKVIRIEAFRIKVVKIEAFRIKVIKTEAFRIKVVKGPSISRLRRILRSCLAECPHSENPHCK
jgi:hypothetical protein